MAEVALDEFTAQHRSAMAFLKRVHHQHVFAVLEQAVDHVRPDKTRPTYNQNLHCKNSCCTNRTGPWQLGNRLVCVACLPEDLANQ